MPIGHQSLDLPYSKCSVGLVGPIQESVPAWTSEILSNRGMYRVDQQSIRLTEEQRDKEMSPWKVSLSQALNLYPPVKATQELMRIPGCIAHKDRG